MSYPYQSLRQGLIGAWCPSISRGTGAILPDNSQRRNNLVNTAIAFQATQGGVAAETNGTSSVAQTTSLAPLLNGVTAATIAGWVWRSSTSQTAGFGFSNSTAQNGGKRFSLILYSDGNLYPAIESTTLNFGTVSASGTGWFHFAIVFLSNGSAANTNAAVYLGGVSRSVSWSGTVPASLSTDLGSFTVGKDSSDRFCTGRYDDVRVYNRALNLAEVRLLASGRGIGLTPSVGTRATYPTKFQIRVGGAWKEADAYQNVGGVWKPAPPSIKVAGVWK